eukprot:scaffold6670_cov330-Prasinococcus_capsulatus_cf.AAC.5
MAPTCTVSAPSTETVPPYKQSAGFKAHTSAKVLASVETVREWRAESPYSEKTTPIAVIHVPRGLHFWTSRVSE